MWPFSRNNTQPVDQHSERDPLLQEAQLSPQYLPDQAVPVPRKPRTPLPARQLSVLCAMRFTEPISYTLIFPFINQMLEHLKVAEDPKKIGYYAGVIESIFAISQLCTAIYWGRLSDRVGRKPVMLTGLIGTTISVVSFGLQKHFLGLLISRAFAGMMNGNVAILQSVVAEITDETNYAEAAALLPLCFACGLIIGPMIGGYLAAPAQQYPLIFGNCQFLIRYPYFLPCLIGGMFNLAAIILGLFCLEETLPSKRKDLDSNESVSVVKPIKAPPPAISSLLTRPVIFVLLTFLGVNLQNTAWSAAVPLYCQTRVEDGGLGLNLNQIGFLLSTQGIGIILTQVFIFPVFQRKWGVRKLLRCSLPFAYMPMALVPFVTKSARLDQTSFSISLALMVFVCFLRSLVTICYVCLFMIIKELSPASNCLGTLNGMMQTGGALSMTFGPIMGSSLYAFSISSGWMGGNLVWVVMIMVSLVPQTLSFLIVITKPGESSEEDGLVGVSEGCDRADQDREIDELNEFLRADDTRIGVPSDHQSTPILIRKSSFASGGNLLFNSVSSRRSFAPRPPSS